MGLSRVNILEKTEGAITKICSSSKFNSLIFSTMQIQDQKNISDKNLACYKTKFLQT